MARTLKKFNGRWAGHNPGRHLYIAAYSQKQAAEILGKVTGYTQGTLGEIRNYFFNCWGNSMDGIEPTQPCAYYTEGWHEQTPVKIL